MVTGAQVDLAGSRAWKMPSRSDCIHCLQLGLPHLFRQGNVAKRHAVLLAIGHSVFQNVLQGGGGSRIPMVLVDEQPGVRDDGIGVFTLGVGDPAREGMGRVDLGGRPPRSPTDPGLHITRTRFLTYDFAALRNRLWTTRGLGKPYRCSSRRKSDQGISPSRRRRESQCRQIVLASSRNSWRLGKLPVIP